jgi:hypothetical protein
MADKNNLTTLAKRLRPLLKLAIVEMGGIGHIIEDDSTSYTQRNKLKFTESNITITDDGTNDATVVEVGINVYHNGSLVAVVTGLNFVDS